MTRPSPVLFSRQVLSDSLQPRGRQHAVSLSFTISRSLPKFMLIESVMSSNHLILCHTLSLLPSLFCSIRVFPNVLAVHIRWPKYWSFRPPAFHQPVRKQLPRLLFDCVAWLVGCDFPSSDQGIQPGKAQSPNHCTAREFPESTVHFLRHFREFKVEDFLPLFVWRWI